MNVRHVAACGCVWQGAERISQCNDRLAISRVHTSASLELGQYARPIVRKPRKLAPVRAEHGVIQRVTGLLIDAIEAHDQIARPPLCCEPDCERPRFTRGGQCRECSQAAPPPFALNLLEE